MAKEYGFYLAGELARSEVRAAVRNPFNQEVLAEVCQASAEQVETAMAAAAGAFGVFGKWPGHRRAEACGRVYRGLVERAEEFARCIALEAGKPIKAARGEVERAITTFRVAAEEATRIGGEQLPVDIDARSAMYHAVVERFPIGPVSFFTPFNFPLNLVAHKVAPAMAAGCPFIVKPSERTPCTALLLGELLVGAELPVGSWSIVPCDRAVGRVLVTDDRIKLFSFTGSPEVGWGLKASAGKKAVVLELGNNSAVIVEPDCVDLAEAVGRIVTAAFSYAGQSCISVQRIYLHEVIAKEATRMLVEATRKLKVGDPMDEATTVGPLMDEAAAVRVKKWIDASGGEVLCGGGVKGSLVEPTLVRGVNRDSKLACEEVFGPVAIIETYSDFGEVLGRVNATRYGLQAGLFTRDLFKVRQAFMTLEVGGLVVNDVPTTRVDNMPYGGVKDSGFGREGVKYAIEGMTERRVLLTRY